MATLLFIRTGSWLTPSSPLSKVKFGEAADQDSQQLFGLISHFVHDFRGTHADLRSGVTAEHQSS